MRDIRKIERVVAAQRRDRTVRIAGVGIIYSCGLRISECVRLSVNDIDGANHKLIVREGKGGKDRYTLLSELMYGQLRRYWGYHRNPVWIFPQIGRGAASSEHVCRRMGQAEESMGLGALQTAIVEALACIEKMTRSVL